MVDINISLIGANNDTIQLTNSDSSYILTSGVSGFGIPPTQLRIAASARDGGVWRYTKRGVRDIDLPIVITGTDRQDLENKLRRLSNLLQDRLGPTTLRASYGDGTSYELKVHYAGGGDVEYGDDSNQVFARWVITVQAPQPFWESTIPTSYTLAQSTTGRGLLPKLGMLKLSGAYGFGDVVLDNPGDVEAYPIWTITGPVTSASITFNGVGFSYDSSIAAGDTITIDTFNGTVVDQNGMNRYANLGTAPKLFAIQPGSTTVSINALGATSATVISAYIKPRREVIH